MHPSLECPSSLCQSGAGTVLGGPGRECPRLQGQQTVLGWWEARGRERERWKEKQSSSVASKVWCVYVLKALFLMVQDFHSPRRRKWQLKWTSWWGAQSQGMTLPWETETNFSSWLTMGPPTLVSGPVAGGVVSSSTWLQKLKQMIRLHMMRTLTVLRYESVCNLFGDEVLIQWNLCYPFHFLTIIVLSSSSL